MVATKAAIDNDIYMRLTEWTGVDNDAATPWVSVSPRTEITVQIMSVSGSPTIGIEGSLNLDADVSKVWGTLRSADTAEGVIAMTTAGDVAQVLESNVVLIRPIRTSGTGTATVRIAAGANI